MSKEQYERTVSGIIKNANIPIEIFNGTQLSTKRIEDMYLNDELSRDTVITLFNNNILGIRDFETLFGDETDLIVELVQQGELNKKALSVLSTRKLSDYLLDGKLTMKEIFDLYSKQKTLDIDNLKEIVDEYETELDLREEAGEDTSDALEIVDLIDKKTGIEKIKELYNAKLLSHGDVIELQEKGIITEEQSEEISKIDREREYDEIFGKTIKVLHIDEEKVKRSGDITNSQNNKRITALEDPEKRKEFFEELGATDFREIRTVESKSQFRGYTVIGFRDYGLVALENFEKKKNATYIMTLQEFKGCTTTAQDNSIIISKSKRMIRKEAKSGRAMKTVSHNPTWGYDVIETVKKLSKEAKKGISTKKQMDLSEKMINEYFKPRLLSCQNDVETTELLMVKRKNILKRIKLAETKKLEKEAEKLAGKTKKEEKKKSKKEHSDE